MGPPSTSCSCYHRQIITPGYRAVLHIHTVQEECAIERIVCELGVPKKQSKPQFVKSRSTIKAIIKVPKRICLEKFDVRPALGRFTLRDEGKSIAIGIVSLLKPAND